VISKPWVPVFVAVVAAFPVQFGCRSNTELLGSYSSGGADNSPVFGKPVAIPTLVSTGNVFTDPTSTGDGLELVVMSTQGGNKDLWRATRVSLTSPWSKAQIIAELRADSAESNPKISADGLRLWFYTDRDRATGTIWAATRAKRSEPFGAPVVVPGLSTIGASDVSACANDDGTAAVISKSIDGETKGYDLYELRRNSPTESFGAKVSLASVNSSDNDYDPWLSPDGLVLVFHSDRSGNSDLFWSSRQTLADEFSTPLPVSSVNTKSAEAAPALLPDLGRIWFASDRDGNERIYEAIAVN